MSLIVDTFRAKAEDQSNTKCCKQLMETFEYFKERAPVVKAALLERMSDLKLLVKVGIDINAQDVCGGSALVMAIDQDLANLEWVELFVANDIDVNLQDNNGLTALDVARYNCNEKAIDLRLQQNAIDKNRPTAKEEQLAQIYETIHLVNANKFKKLINFDLEKFKLIRSSRFETYIEISI